MFKKVAVLAIVFAYTVSADLPIINCSGDCTPTCQTQACQPPPVPCPAAGPPWC